MPRKRKTPVSFDIPEEVRSAPQAGWVRPEAAEPEEVSAASGGGAEERPPAEPASARLQGTDEGRRSSRAAKDSERREPEVPEAGRSEFSEAAASASLLPARQYVWTVPPPGRLVQVRDGVERGIAWCAVPFEIGYTIVLALCARAQAATNRAPVKAAARSGGKDEP